MEIVDGLDSDDIGNGNRRRERRGRRGLRFDDLLSRNIKQSNATNAGKAVVGSGTQRTYALGAFFFVFCFVARKLTVRGLHWLSAHIKHSGRYLSSSNLSRTAEKNSGVVEFLFTVRNHFCVFPLTEISLRLQQILACSRRQVNGEFTLTGLEVGLKCYQHPPEIFHEPLQKTFPDTQHHWVNDDLSPFFTGQCGNQTP